MSDTMQLTTTTPQPLAPADLQLCAQGPDDMPKCQAALVEWTIRKIARTKAEAAEFQAEYEHAIKRKWKSDAFKRHAAAALKRVTFYEKMLAALRAGYYIVPNFPCSLFAIRTDRKKPLAMWTNKFWLSAFQQEAKALPQGEGQYQSPNPQLRAEDKYEKLVGPGDRKEMFQVGWADAWDALEFPLNMAKLEIMEASTRAMALKVFDEIAFYPEDYKRHPDPILLGRIIDPTTPRWSRKRITFMIAWHIDTRTL